jgi:hypothetical protein
MAVDIVDLEKVHKKDSHDDITEHDGRSEPAKPKEGPYTAKELREQAGGFRDKVKNSRRHKDDQGQTGRRVDRMFDFPIARMQRHHEQLGASTSTTCR